MRHVLVMMVITVQYIDSELVSGTQRNVQREHGGTIYENSDTIIIIFWYELQCDVTVLMIA